MLGRVRAASWFSMLLIVSLCILNYGLRLNRLGLYELDWFHFNLYTTKGVQGLLQYGSVDRLLAGVPLALPFVLFGENMAFRHATVLIVHTATALLMLGILKRLLVGQMLFCTLAASLFAVYPAVESLFWNAQIHSSTSMFLTVLSIYLMLLALRPGQVNWFVAVVAALIGLVALLIYELPLGLELSRPLLLWVASGRDARHTVAKRVRWVGWAWLPFALMLAAFLVWRVALYPGMIAGARLAIVGERSIVSLVITILRNYSLLILYTWRAPLTRLLDPHAFWMPWVPWLTAAMATAMVFTFVAFARASERQNHPVRMIRALADSKYYLGLAVVGLALTGLGFAASLPTGYKVPLPNSLLSRIDLAATPGAALTLVAAAMALARAITARWQMLGGLIIAVFIGLATGSNFIVQEQFVAEWLSQQSIWWQLTWRAPQLGARTYLLLTGPTNMNALGRPFDDFEVSSALDYLYKNTTLRGEQVTAYTLARLHPDGLKPQAVSYDSAFVPYNRMLVAQYGQGCLKIVDAKRFVLDANDPFLNAVAHFSNQENITLASEGEVHPQREKILGAPPLKDWCYFYERAEWYRQQRQWAEIAHLYDSIEGLGLRPEDASEWVPFIEALDRMGNYARADALVFYVTIFPNPRASQSLRSALEELRRDSAELGDQQLVEQTSAQLARLR